MKLRFTIGRKLSLGFGVLLVAIMVNGILTFITLKKTERLNTKIADVYTPSISYLKDLNLLLIRSKNLIGTWLQEDENVPGKSELKRIHDVAYPDLKKEIKTVVKGWDVKDKERMDSTLVGIDSIIAIQHEIMLKFFDENEYWEPTSRPQERGELKENFESGVINNNITGLQDDLKEIIKTQKEYANDASAEMSEAFARLRLYVLYLGIFLLLGGVIIAFFTIRSIVSPVNKLKDVLLIMGKGILPQSSIEAGNDEIGEMSEALNKLVHGLKRTSDFSKEIGQGNFRFEYEPLSKDDTLGNSLLIMRDNLSKVAEEDKRRNWSTGGLAKFGEILRKHSDNVSELANTLVSELIKYSEANQGRVFIINNDDLDDQYMELVGCYAWDRIKYLDQKVIEGDGLVGQAWQEKRTLYITDVPNDYIKITSGLGDSNPRCLLIVPLKVNEEVFGVIEIASFYAFEEYQVKFVERLAETTASTINTVKVNERTKILLEQSQVSSEQMRLKEDQMEKEQIDMEQKFLEMEESIQDKESENVALKIKVEKYKDENITLQNILLKTSKDLDKYKKDSE